MVAARFFARSASDKTDDWGFWFVADRKLGGLNRTAELMREINLPHVSGQTLGSRVIMEALALRANELGATGQPRVEGAAP